MIVSEFKNKNFSIFNDSLINPKVQTFEYFIHLLCDSIELDFCVQDELLRDSTQAYLYNFNTNRVYLVTKEISEKFYAGKAAKLIAMPFDDYKDLFTSLKPTPTEICIDRDTYNAILEVAEEYYENLEEDEDDIFGGTEDSLANENLDFHLSEVVSESMFDTIREAIVNDTLKDILKEKGE